MAKVESGVRVSSMLRFVLVYCISLSNCADAGDRQRNEAGINSPARFFHLGTLTEKQEKSIVTIEFNCTDFDTENRTNVDSMYRNVHKAILERLNRGKSNTTTITPSRPTALVATAPTPTMMTPTRRQLEVTLKTTTTLIPPLGPNKKKRKKREKILAVYDAKDLRFLELDPETLNGILAMSLLLVGKDDRDCGIILLEAANETIEDGTLDRVAGVPVVTIYRGFPPNRRTVLSHRHHNYSLLIWPLVITLVILLLIVIAGYIYGKKKQDKLEVTSANESN